MLSALQVTGFSKLGSHLEQIVIIQLSWPLGLVQTLVIIGLGKRGLHLHVFYLLLSIWSSSQSIGLSQATPTALKYQLTAK